MTPDQKLLKIIDLLQDGKVTQDDFVKAIGVLVQFVKEIKQLTEDEVDELKELAESIREAAIGQEKATRERMSAELAKAQDALLKRIAAIQDGKDGKDGADGKDADPDEVADIVFAKIPKVPAIKDVSREVEELSDKVAELEEELKKVKRIRNAPIFGVGGGLHPSKIKDIDISSQLNGVLSTFNIEGVYNVISVHLSSFPHALRKTVDFTYTTTTITFTSQIDPATSLAAGQTCVLTVVSM